VQIRHSILIFLTSKEDHTYVRGEIYQRVIAIHKSKDRSCNGQERDKRANNDPH
jgi:hypothetical protein